MSTQRKKPKISKVGHKPKIYKIRHKIAWMWDMDYIDDLDDETRGWLMKFCDEFYHGAVKKFGIPGQIHQDREMIKELYRHNNYRNKDLMNEYRIRVYKNQKTTSSPENKDRSPDKRTVTNVFVGVPSNVQFKKFRG